LYIYIEREERERRERGEREEREGERGERGEREEREERERGIDFVSIIEIFLMKVMPNIKYVQARFNVFCTWFILTLLLINLLRLY
jgi:hypothetical protein